MGFDTYVNIGERTLVDWRKQTSWLPRLLFQRTDLVVEAESSDGTVTGLRFHTTAEQCLATLEANGFGWHATVASYEGVRSSSTPEAMLWGTFASEAQFAGRPDEEVEAWIEEQLELAGRSVDAEGDLRALGELWAGQWLDPAVEDVLLFSKVVWDEPFELSSNVLFSALSVVRASGKPPFPVLRGLVATSLLMAEARMVAWPLVICILLRHLPPDTLVIYELTEGLREFSIGDEPSAINFVDEFWDESGSGMADYSEKIGVLYGTLAAFQSGLGRAFWLGRTATALGRLDDLNRVRTPSDRKARGDALEELVASLVQTESPELRLMAKNFRTTEEEIDLILTNGLADPFWLSFGSPTIFIECKNWQDPVGVAELRVFESKMEDRRAVAKIGIFVSMSGFTTPFMTRLKEIQSRGVGVIFALTGDDLRQTLVDRIRLTDWLRSEGFARAFGQ